ncbi:unnamed protein product [Clonostachys solani]|uniref:Uncharacterized protein n=1 Tax=Clonostachys solani TaxID=160281 RepID=A0A9N9ZEY2_9HYPO|nr:unnamed protein product [Clonostachys solani]
MSFSKIPKPQLPAPGTPGAKYNTTPDPDWSGRDINKPCPPPGPIQPTESHGPMAPLSHQTLGAEHNTALNDSGRDATLHKSNRSVYKHYARLTEYHESNVPPTTRSLKMDCNPVALNESGRDIRKRHPLPSSPICRGLDAKHYIAPESHYDTTLGESGRNTYPSDSDDPTVLNDDRQDEYNARDSDEDYFSAENDTIPNNSIRNTTQARGNHHLDTPPSSLAISNSLNSSIMHQTCSQTRNTISRPTPNRGTSYIYPPDSAFPIHSQSLKELLNIPSKQPTLGNSGTLRIQSDSLSPGLSSSTTEKRRLTQQNEMNPQEVDNFNIWYPDRLSQGSSISEEELDIKVFWKATRITYNDLSSGLRKLIYDAYALNGKKRLQAFKRLISDIKI